MCVDCWLELTWEVYVHTRAIIVDLKTKILTIFNLKTAKCRPEISNFDLKNNLPKIWLVKVKKKCLSTHMQKPLELDTCACWRDVTTALVLSLAGAFVLVWLTQGNAISRAMSAAHQRARNNRIGSAKYVKCNSPNCVQRWHLVPIDTFIIFLSLVEGYTLNLKQLNSSIGRC